jgi:hypothetical protein
MNLRTRLAYDWMNAKTPGAAADTIIHYAAAGALDMGPDNGGDYDNCPSGDYETGRRAFGGNPAATAEGSGSPQKRA